MTDSTFEGIFEISFSQEKESEEVEIRPKKKRGPKPKPRSAIVLKNRVSMIENAKSQSLLICNHTFQTTVHYVPETFKI